MNDERIHRHNWENGRCKTCGVAQRRAPQESAVDEDPTDFWAPLIVGAVVVVVVLVAMDKGASACAIALIAHLFRAMAKDDMKPNDGTERRLPPPQTPESNQNANGGSRSLQ